MANIDQIAARMARISESAAKKIAEKIIAEERARHNAPRPGVRETVIRNR